jgi:hypothetical protein
VGTEKEREHESSFREQVYLVALAALIKTHPNWLEACLVTSAERIACMSSRILDEHTS